MLKFLRKKTKPIVWTVVIAFVAWGGYAVSLQFEDSSRSPGRIFGKEVSFREYQLANRAVQIFSPKPDPANPPKMEEIEARTWEFLILSREAKSQKIEVTDEEVRQEIRLLLPQGGSAPLTSEQYLGWIQKAFREEPWEFESQLREHLRIRKFLNEARTKIPDKTEEGLKNWLLDLYRRAKIEVYRPR
jgi:hypothetical protein